MDIRKVPVFCIAMAAVMTSTATPALAAECGNEQYFHPNDFGNEAPSTRPHREFSRMLAQARRGNPLEQRNLAASYEGGYLVTGCPAKAEFWYRKAAGNGDEAARQWVGRRDALMKLASGPECFGHQCNGNGEGIPRIMSVVADPKGHYFADLTINGVTVRGLIDTGATHVALGTATAAKMGITVEGGQQGMTSTANGKVSTVSKNIPHVKIGNITLDNVMVSIGASDDQPLIGMSVIGRLKMTAENGRMTLSK